MVSGLEKAAGGECSMRNFGALLWPLVALVLAGAAPGSAETLIGLGTPLTGPYAWPGAATKEAFRLAVADLNAPGGVLGQMLQVVEADDFCDGEQAVAAATKLVAAGVVAVFGHQCSGAAIPASQVYANAGLLMIATEATNPVLTERGLTNVFRMVGRDDLQGRIAADLLVERWRSKPIAILHDGQAYGKGLAEETRKGLDRRGIKEVMFEAIEPGKADYWEIVQKMRKLGVEVLYYGGYGHEAGLIIRQAKEHGYPLQLVAGDGLSNQDFGLVAGAASDGTLMTYYPSPSGPEAARIAAKLTAEGLQPTFASYAAVQVWAAAAEQAGTVDAASVAAALRTHSFDTVLGRIGFDAKGDVTGYATFVWYVWQDGRFAPKEVVN
jgi:branched-chain amino acid transport system substrate-binding protein